MVEDGTSSGDEDGIDWLNGPDHGPGHNNLSVGVGAPKRSNSRRKVGFSAGCRSMEMVDEFNFG